MNSPGPRTAVVVGAGIQGLLTALALRERGFAVRVHAAGADPRSGGVTRSSTSDGEAIRLITPLEGCPYVGHAADSPEIAGIFEKPYSQGGWLGRATMPDEADWLRRRQAAWQDRERVAKALHWYAETSRRAMTLWPKLRAEHPRVFANVDWLECPVLRLYDDTPTALTAREVHRQLGINAATLYSPQIDPNHIEILRGYPWLGEAWQRQRIGGAFTVGGTALNIKRLVRNLINDLERRKVHFAWHSECQHVSFDNNNQVKGLQFNNGMIRADDYVIAPGAYAGPELLRSLGVELAGLAGRWLLIAKPQNWGGPVKIHLGPRLTASGPRPVLDLNLFPYFDADRQQEMLAIGGGYLHVGQYPFSYDKAEMRLLDADIAAAVSHWMPNHYAEAQAADTLVRSAATCVRSITADDRPAVADFLTDTGGRLIFHAGLNTGTTTMAPAIAADIAAVLCGEIGPESLVF